jgi:hypothetical protein
MSTSASPGITIIEPSVAEVSGWPSPESLLPPKNDRLEMLARLEKLSAARTEDADKII